MKMFSDPGRFRSFFSGVPGVKKTLFYFIAVIVIWTAFFAIWGRTGDLEARLDLKENRFDQLLALVEDYRLASGETKEGSINTGSGKEPVQIISDLLGQLEIRDKLVQLSMTGNGINLQLKDLYVEDLANLVENLEKNGLKIDSAEIKALSASGGRVLDMSLIVVTG